MLKPCDECLTPTDSDTGWSVQALWRTRRSCTWKYRTEVSDVEFLEAWKRGDIVVSRGEGHNRRFNGPARRVLLRLADNKCQLCGWGETNPHTGKIPLETDHINGDPYDDRLENLRVLCPNCHALTSTYKGANRGKGRTIQAPIV